MAETTQRVILLVDDEQQVAGLVKRRLESMGHKIVTAANGVEALQFAEKLKPSVVILDQIMPGKHGVEVLKELKQNPATKGIKVIFFTAHTAAGFEEECIHSGALGIFYKPVVAELIEALKIILSGKKFKWGEPD